MRRSAQLTAAALLFLVPAAAEAGAFGLFQHGGRAMGQAGALTARAPDASAIHYNPAALTRLARVEYQLALDFSAPRDDYESVTGDHSAAHLILPVPAAYATWNPPGTGVAFGIGVDSPLWYVENWNTALFPGRFLTRRFELSLLEAHPVVAFEIGERWSVGGGVRYLAGEMEQGDNGRIPAAASTGPVTVEIERRAEADLDGWGADLAVHFSDPVWGWGAVLRSGVELEGSGEVTYRPRDVPADPVLADNLRGRFGDGDARQSFELPPEIRTGIWMAPYPELRLELDLAYQMWSVIERTEVTYDPDPFGTGPTVVTRRDWNDTVSLRLGLEGDVTDAFMLYGGVGLEPSPVPASTLEPGLPRGEALVYAFGFSIDLNPRVALDVGYSLHDHEERNASGQELLAPDVDSRYSAQDQVFGVTGRWAFE